MAHTTGAKFMAEALKASGVTHVFVAPAIAREALAELSQLGVKSIVTHGEKAAAYMADGYARAANRPAICFAQSVGTANLAAGLQDSYLTLSPLITMTGIVHGPGASIGGGSVAAERDPDNDTFSSTLRPTH